MNKSRTTHLASFGLVALLIVSFVTLSGWQSVKSDSKAVQDTTKKSNKKAGYSKTTIITIGEDGVPHEQIIENFDGDEGLRKLVVPGHDFDFVMPNLPRFDGFQFNMPDFPSEFHFPPMPDFEFDSLNGFGFNFDKDFEGFAEQFQAFGPEFEDRMRLMEEQLEKMDLSWNHQLEGMDKNWEEQMERLGDLDEDLEKLDFDLKGLDENLKHLDEDLKFMNEEIKAFEEAAQKELVNDGYLEKGEKIESMQWNDDDIKFNGKTIKPEHVEKYKTLKDKHIKQQWRRGRPE